MRAACPGFLLFDNNRILLAAGRLTSIRASFQNDIAFHESNDQSVCGHGERNGIATVRVRVTPFGAGPEEAIRRTDAAARHAEAASELLIQDAGEDRRQLVEARGCDSDLRATFNGLIRWQLAAR